MPAQSTRQLCHLWGVLERNAVTIVERLPDEALVLDVGGWASPFPRADWVLDLGPFETRGLYGYEGGSTEERFTERTWIRRDICDREPWPFADDQFDFVVCAHTLEDIRDPVWVCQELRRVGRAGYIETPSRAEEQSWGVQGPWVGWSHHRWLVDVVHGTLRFVMKPAVLHARDHFPGGHADALSDEERVVVLWWEGTFDAEERHFESPEELHRYLGAVVGHGGRTPAEHAPAAGARADRQSGPAVRRLGSRLRQAASSAATRRMSSSGS